MIKKSKLIVTFLVASIISISLTACQGSAGAKLGGRHVHEVINGVGSTHSELYGELYVNFTFGAYEYSPLSGYLQEGLKGSSFDPSTWEVELDSSSGIISLVQNNKATIMAFSSEQMYSSEVFSIKNVNNKIRFSAPKDVETWILQQAGLADKFRVELTTTSQNTSNNQGSVAVKMNQDGVTQALYSFPVNAGGSACNPDGPPSEVDIIC